MADQFSTTNLVEDAALEAAYLPNEKVLYDPIARVAGCDTGWTAPTVWLESWVYRDGLVVVDTAIQVHRATIRNVIEGERGLLQGMPQLVGLGPDGPAVSETSGESVAGIISGYGCRCVCRGFSTIEKARMIRDALEGQNPSLRLRYTKHMVKAIEQLVGVQIDIRASEAQFVLGGMSQHWVDATVYLLHAAGYALRGVLET